MAELIKLVGMTEKEVYSGTAEISKKAPVLLFSTAAEPSSVVTAKL